ncbi:MAG: hypothetical protein WC676_06785 [Candidatus Omnitrophota bacterium]
MKRALLVVFAALFLSSCSLYVIDSNETSLEYYSPKSSANDVAYLETVDKPHEMIGIVTVNVERTQSENDTAKTEIINKLKQEAATMGGDAITNIQTNAGTGAWAKAKPKKLFGNANIRTNFTADVVVFK